MSELVKEELGEVGTTQMFAELVRYPSEHRTRLCLYRKVGSERVVICYLPMSASVQLGEFLVEVAATYGVCDTEEVG